MKPVVAALVMAGWLAGQTAPSGAPTHEASASELRPLIERFSADRDSLNRTYAIRFSETRRTRLDRFYAEQQEALNKVNFPSLSQEGRVDYLLFRNLLARQRRQLQLEGVRDREMDRLLPFSGTIVHLEEARKRMESVDPRKAADAVAPGAPADFAPVSEPEPEFAFAEAAVPEPESYEDPTPEAESTRSMAASANGPAQANSVPQEQIFDDLEVPAIMRRARRLLQ